MLAESHPRNDRGRHEEKNMFNKNSKRFANWFPGKPVTHDRWGDLIGTEVKSREFQAGSSTVSDAAARMRWSLGHA